MHFNAKDRVGLARRRQTEAQNDQVLETFKAAVALSVGEGEEEEEESRMSCVSDGALAPVRFCPARRASFARAAGYRLPR